jgi:hypothetical protein
MSTLNFDNGNNAYFSNVKAYPSSTLHKSNNFKSLGDTSVLPYNVAYNNCKNTSTNDYYYYYY